ncbi:MAG: O-antigen polysaccharide polymerase Wzy family protein [Paludibacteraceae bacterium]|nr:O-antigen polysaccharide polymerase Wzy family protein [Paludibacteraceae bacterium]
MIERWINIVCVVLGLIAYYLAPEGYDYTFCMGLAVLYIVQNACWLALGKHTNWVRFELFFMISFFFVNFGYPVIYAPIYAHWSFFIMDFNRQVINQATAMAYLAYSCYMVGITGWREKEEPRFTKQAMVEIETFRILCGVAIVGFGLFIATGGYTALKDVYSGGKDLRDVGIYSYFNNIFSIGALLMAAMVFRLDEWHRRSYLGVLGVFIAVLLSTGSRQFSISLVIVLLVSYSWYIYRLKGWQVACIMLAGAMALFVIVQTRAGVGGVGDKQIVSVFDVFEDLSINAINLYVLVDWGNSHDCTWLHGLLLDLVSPIPKLGTWLADYMGEAKELLHGGDLPSYILLGRGAHWGTGTNMVGEAYRGFGIAGMCLIMWGIGALIRVAYYRAEENIYWNVFYMLMVGHAVIYPRAPLLYDPRTIVWTMVLLWLVQRIRRKEATTCA